MEHVTDKLLGEKKMCILFLLGKLRELCRSCAGTNLLNHWPAALIRISALSDSQASRTAVGFCGRLLYLDYTIQQRKIIPNKIRTIIRKQHGLLLFPKLVLLGVFRRENTNLQTDLLPSSGGKVLGSSDLEQFYLTDLICSSSTPERRTETAHNLMLCPEYGVR